MSQAKLIFVVLAAILGLQLLVGNIRAALFPGGTAAAFTLARYYRWTGAAFSVLPLALFLLGAFLLRIQPDLVWYYLAFTILGMSVGMAQGCVHAAASWLKVDPVEHPFRAFNIGFGIQIVLLFVPVINAGVLTWFTLWGFSGLTLRALGYTAPEEEHL